MHITIDNGCLNVARQVMSPNYDDRPPEANIDLLVVHAISLPPGDYCGHCIEDFFTNSLDARVHPYFTEIADLKVSAHLLIRRDGELVQFVPFDKRAWHAGHSLFQGRDNCNDFSIGVELEGCDNDSFEEQQYQALAAVITAIRNEYPAINPDRIVGHSDIAPGRKTDPGPAFDWKHLYELVAKG